MQKGITEHSINPFYFGNRLKALIWVGSSIKTKEVKYYRVECYRKKREVERTTVIRVNPLIDKDKAWEYAMKYAVNYLNTCKY